MNERASFSGCAQSGNGEQSTFTPNSLQEQILARLSKGVANSKRLRSNVSGAPSTFYKALGELKDRRLVIFDKVGREVMYALPDRAAELFSSTKRQTELERHVINNALRLINEILQIKRTKHDPTPHKTILYHCYLLYEAVLVLREKYPSIPQFGAGPEKKAGPELGQWYRYWIQVLQVLSVF